MLLELALEVGAAHAGLNRDRPRLLVDLDDAVEAAEVEHDGAPDGRCAAADAGAEPARHDRGSRLVGPTEQRGNLLRPRGPCDRGGKLVEGSKQRERRAVARERLERFRVGREETGRRVEHRGREATIEQMAETTDAPLEQQLEEIGTQLAWVRDYL